MKIMHCCLAAFYIDNYSYQENILPKMHKQQGHIVHILASTETYNSNLQLDYLHASSYINENGISVTRIPYITFLPHFLAKKLRIYKGLKKELDTFKPDILFVHDCQFLSIWTLKQYKIKNPNVKIFVDGHTDFINSGRNWISKNILHKIIYKFCAKMIEPVTEKFYGVLPLRVDFFKDVYKINPDKVELLSLGVDDSLFEWNDIAKIRLSIRQSLGITENDFVFISGGKIDRRKNIDLVIKAFDELNKGSTKLIIFGKPDSEMKSEIETLTREKQNILYVGWLNNQEICNYLLASDLAIYPGTHSILWEMSLGLGIPCLFKKWTGMEHLRISNQIDFLQTVSTQEILSWMKKCVCNNSYYRSLKEEIVAIGRKKFSYFEIAKTSIEIAKTSL